ncbi:hypothetical protein BXZ70DRAFT_1067272 [Cristinia sonorae]|uniref:F-box domain-containing protein n=1 Tax=Cristinia sonorae TaxID=1940300 RepID=A0A8K0XM95_9AGAR|nr:hypothetical protein BXZ70DRAFT_1067272 [Cristinia sonorae]
MRVGLFHLPCAAEPQQLSKLSSSHPRHPERGDFITQSHRIPRVHDNVVAECGRIVQIYQEIVRKMQEKRNGYAVVHRLPDELLCAIFENIIDRGPDSIATSSSVAIPIGQVCRRWRAIATDSPWLWATIVASGLSNMERIRSFLSLSRSRPLTVDLADLRGRERYYSEDPYNNSDTVVPRASTAYDALLAELPRIQHLRMTMTAKLANAALAWLSFPYSQPAPHLETLDMDLEASNDVVDFILSLFPPDLPSLRILRIKCSNFTKLLSLVTPSLTVLELTQHRMDADDEDSEELEAVLALLAALRSMALLETLKLECSLPDILLGVSLPDSSVVLSRLRILDLRIRTLMSRGCLTIFRSRRV